MNGRQWWRPPPFERALCETLHGRCLGRVAVVQCLGMVQNAKPEIRERFGNVVRSRRGELGLTQEELAGRAGLHRAYISDIERGSRNVSLVNIEQLADAVSGLRAIPASGKEVNCSRERQLCRRMRLRSVPRRSAATGPPGRSFSEHGSGCMTPASRTGPMSRERLPSSRRKA